MNIDVIQQRLKQYHCKTRLDERNALKEITQEVALLALSKANFFKVAEFHGGTALRILHGLQRFSEDLDFALLEPKASFDLSKYLEHMCDEFEAFGYKTHISDRTEVMKTVQKQFLKVDSIGKLLTLQYPMLKDEKKIKIKLEIDTNPPLGAMTEIQYLTFPIPFSVLAKDLASSFSGKLHALLCRVFDKGRDWYDFIWYVNQKTPVNYTLLSNALHQQGPWQGESLRVDKSWLLQALRHKIASVSWQDVINDIRPLLKADEIHSLSLWKPDFFLSLVDKLQKSCGEIKE